LYITYNLNIYTITCLTTQFGQAIMVKNNNEQKSNTDNYMHKEGNIINRKWIQSL